MSYSKITIETLISARPRKIWESWTEPKHITQWNFAIDTWHCPRATNDLKVGGKYTARMEAKDGSFGFDFVGTYTTLIENKRIEYEFGGRRATVDFTPHGHRTHVRVTFDPDSEFPIEQQRNGWQSILDNFANHLAASSASE